MGMVDEAKLQEIQQRMLHHWPNVHPDFGRRIADGLGRAGIRQAAE